MVYTCCLHRPPDAAAQTDFPSCLPRSLTRWWIPTPPTGDHKGNKAAPNRSPTPSPPPRTAILTLIRFESYPTYSRRCPMNRGMNAFYKAASLWKVEPFSIHGKIEPNLDTTRTITSITGCTSFSLPPRSSVIARTPKNTVPNLA